QYLAASRRVPTPGLQVEIKRSPKAGKSRPGYLCHIVESRAVGHEGAANQGQLRGFSSKEQRPEQRLQDEHHRPGRATLRGIADINAVAAPLRPALRLEA